MGLFVHLMGDQSDALPAIYILPALMRILGVLQCVYELGGPTDAAIDVRR